MFLKYHFSSFSATHFLEIKYVILQCRAIGTASERATELVTALPFRQLVLKPPASPRAGTIGVYSKWAIGQLKG